MVKDKKYQQPQGWRVTLSIGTAVGWLIFVIIWLAFYAGDYSFYKNLAIILISILVVFIVLCLPWASWGIKQIPKEGKEMMRTAGFTSRVIFSIIVPFAIFIFWIYWFFFSAEAFTAYQNVAIFLVSLLVMGGILGGMWASWGMKHKDDFEKCGEDCKEKDD